MTPSPPVLLTTPLDYLTFRTACPAPGPSPARAADYAHDPALGYQIPRWRTRSRAGVPDPALEYRAGVSRWSTRCRAGVQDPALEYQISRWSIALENQISRWSTRSRAGVPDLALEYRAEIPDLAL
eukprot:gene16403-biopygen10598